MARYKITRVEIVEVSTDFPGEEGFGLEDLKDTVQDDILNSQDVHSETDDGKFVIVPRELVELKIELVEGK